MRTETVSVEVQIPYKADLVEMISDCLDTDWQINEDLLRELEGNVTEEHTLATQCTRDCYCASYLCIDTFDSELRFYDGRDEESGMDPHTCMYNADCVMIYNWSLALSKVWDKVKDKTPTDRVWAVLEYIAHKISSDEQCFLRVVRGYAGINGVCDSLI